MKACIVITITANDSGPEVSALFGVGGTGLKDYEAGRDQDESGEFARWVLAQGGTAYTFTNGKGNQEEVEVVALIAFNSNVSQAVRNRIGQAKAVRPTLCRDLEFNPPITRAQMADRLKVEVGQEIGADLYWHCKPNDDVTTGVDSPSALFAKFALVADLLAKKK